MGGKVVENYTINKQHHVTFLTKSFFLSTLSLIYFSIFAIINYYDNFFLAQQHSCYKSSWTWHLSVGKAKVACVTAAPFITICGRGNNGNPTLSLQWGSIVNIWENYNISLTWIKAIWGWFPLLTMIIVRSQWGRYNLPSNIYIYSLQWGLYQTTIHGDIMGYKTNMMNLGVSENGIPHMAILIYLKIYRDRWLVVYLPLWKIWVRQLGLLFPIYGNTKHVPNHQPDSDD